MQVLALFLLILFLGTLFLFWAWMLVDCATKERSEGNDKIVWTIVIVFTHIVGALLYFFVRQPRRLAELHR